MGAWDVGFFENDDAMDWLALLEEEGASAIEAAFAAALDGPPEYLERDVGASALAAAAVVAALRGRPGSGLPREAGVWVATHAGAATAQVAERARRALDRAADPERSEVAELWRDSGDDAWLRAVADLRSRLG